MPIFKPTYNIDGDVTDIDIKVLENAGVKGIIFDLDSTLIASKSGELTQEVADWLEKARHKFRMVVVSNNKRHEYLEKVREVLAMPVIGFAWKPSRKAFCHALNMLGLKAEETVVVGDRPLTDIWGGQRCGMRTVLVRPLKTIVEPSWKTFFRELERVLIQK
ncbi:MAG TPA: YqeG family HAD IIIA-type phosphatase [Candidatus Obscuribacterales bacterium]